MERERQGHSGAEGVYFYLWGNDLTGKKISFQVRCNSAVDNQDNAGIYLFYGNPCSTRITELKKVIYQVIKQAKLLLLYFLLQVQQGFGQNMIINPGFEDFSFLPDDIMQWDRCSNWNNVNIGPFGWPYASPDYLHMSGSGLAQLPSCEFGTLNPYEGNAVMGLVLYTGSAINFREYISTQLTTPMMPGKKYRISFWITNGAADWYSGSGCNNLGVCLSSSPLIQNDHEPIGRVPQMEITSETWTTTWQNISFEFISDSVYHHITIGNFRDDAATTYMPHVTADSEDGAYYFLDAFEVLPWGPNINGDAFICPGDSSVLTAHGDSTHAWATADDPTFVFSTDSVITVSPTSTQTYLFYGTNDTVSFTVNVVDPLHFSLGPDTGFCEGNTLVLDPGLAETYLWQDGSTGNIYEVNEIGWYWVQAANACGTLTDSVYVFVTPLPLVDLGPDRIVPCGIPVVLGDIMPGTSYIWQDGSTGLTYTTTTAGTYVVQASNVCGTSSDAVEITFMPTPVVELGPDQHLFCGEHLLLDVYIPGAAYLWQDGSVNALYDITASGMYRVEIVSGNCMASDSISIFYHCDSVNLPNVFSPNGDGINDVYMATMPNTLYLNTKIFNRWGNLVFTSDADPLVWDGRNDRGEQVSGGTYYVLLEQTTRGGMINRRGIALTLVR